MGDNASSLAAMFGQAASQGNQRPVPGPPMFEPYDPAKHQPQDLGLGGMSTEYTATQNAPDGGFWNIPTIWYTQQGEAQLLDPKDAQALAQMYEQQTGRRFPRYETPEIGAERAMHRSAMGGATQGRLAK
jgi:hypothetical protein